MSAKTYDTKCYDLAAVFLSDHPHLDTTERVDALADHIQQAIEDWIAYAQDNYEPPEFGDAWTGGFAENH